VLLIRRIRDLLYEQGFTISGARNQLADSAASHAPAAPSDEPLDAGLDEDEADIAPAPQASPARDPATRTRATDARADFTQLDDAALEAMAREDLAIIERAQRGVGEFATTASHVHAVASIPAGNAGVRAAALQTRRASPTASATPMAAPGVTATPEQLRDELLAIRALLVG